jgi:hypothetical protein
VVFDFSMYQALALSKEAPHAKAQYRFFDVFTGLEGIEQVEVVGEEKVSLMGRSFATVAVKSRTLLPESPPAESTRWVMPITESGSGGRLIQIKYGEGPLVYQAATQAQAQGQVENLLQAMGIRHTLFGAAKPTP